MKYSKLMISGLPKAFNVTYAGDYVQDLPDDSSPEDILYDFYFADVDEDSNTPAANSIQNKEYK